MPQSPADTFTLIVTLTNRLANELPRNSQIAELRFLLHEYGKQQPKAPRKRVRDWAAQKRRQRARRRQLIAATAQESVKDTP
jgi:hypothetical protein